MTNSIELLSPAGSIESLRAAVQNGADAVYFGGKSFGARQFAGNFDNKEMEYAIDYCHLRGVKAYLTVNTLVLGREMAQFEQHIKFARECGIDAFIVQDMGAASLVLEIAPDVPIHGSTQTTVHNLEGAKTLKKLGFSRLVLPRELTAEQVGNITENSGIEAELFVHGALCICYSGQCLMSSIIGRRSGNRGRCAQPCRLPYTLLKMGKDVKEGYLLNPKDLCLVEELDIIRKLGVKSLKIEGRMKGPEYVATVTSIYRKYLDFGGEIDRGDIELMESAFSRGGFTKGFFGGVGGKELIRIGNSNDDVYSGKSMMDFSKTYTENANLRRINAQILFKAVPDKPPALTGFYGDIEVTCEGDEPVQKAVNRELTKEQVIGQLEKTDKSPFVFDKIDVEIEKGLFLPVSGINSIRRKLIERLETEVVNFYKRGSDDFVGEICGRARRPVPTGAEFGKVCEGTFQSHNVELGVCLTAQVQNVEQAGVLIGKGLKRVYAPIEVVLGLGYMDEIVPMVPDIITDENMGYYVNKLNEAKALGYKMVYTGNLGMISVAKGMGFEVWGGNALNIFNSRAINVYADMGLSGVEVSRELNLGQISGLAKATCVPLEMVVYGRIALMTMKNCVISTVTNCGDCSNGGFSLKDRKGEIFPVMGDERRCINTILNSKPIYTADMFGELKKCGINFLKMIFTVENSVECDKIYNVYKNALDGNVMDKSMGFEYTRGHLNRGVE